MLQGKDSGSIGVSKSSSVHSILESEYLNDKYMPIVHARFGMYFAENDLKTAKKAFEASLLSRIMHWLIQSWLNYIQPKKNTSYQQNTIA